MQNNFPTILKKFDKDTKFIVHGAKIHQVVPEDLCLIRRHIIGLNTLISDTAAENIAVSSIILRFLN